MDLCGASSSTTPKQLPTALQLHILSFMSPNDRALSGRLASPHIADALSGPQHCTAFLSQPLPPHAVPWALEVGQQHVRQLPFRRKLLLMCTAAASGSVANLEVALALLRPNVFPDVLQQGSQVWGQLRVPRDPGVAAIEAGHPQLLCWLLRHCPGLLRPDLVLEAAARHCDLEGLQAAWWGLRDGHPSRTRSGINGRPTLNQRVLDAAAGSATTDAMAKFMWALGGGSEVGLRASTAAAAAGLGDLRRLCLLRRWGCPVSAFWVPIPALQHADLAVVQWLVDEAGCELPTEDAGGGDESWYALFEACVTAVDGVAKLKWLQERGAPPLLSDHPQLKNVMEALAKGGHVEVLRYLLLQPGMTTERGLAHLQNAAAQSGCVPMVELLRQQGGGAFTSEAYCYAAHSGSVAMVRWLANEGGAAPAELTPSQAGALLANWPRDTHTHSRGLLEAVQLLVDAAGRSVWHTEAAITAATRRGELPLVQYLLQQRPGYCAGGLVFQFAAEAGCEALLEWLVVEHGADGCTGRDSPYTWPAMVGNLGALTSLRRLGVPWGAESVVVRAVRQHSGVDALRWLVEQGAPVGPKEGMYEAVELEVALGNIESQTAVWLRGVAETEAEAEAGQGA